MRACVYTVVFLTIAAGAGQSQTAKAWPVSTVTLPAPVVDGNSPVLAADGEIRVYTSTGNPLLMRGPNLFELSNVDSPIVVSDHYPLWIEAVWRDEDGTVFGWYHHEPGGICDGKLTAPKIGALISTDGGFSFRDLGIVLSSGDPVNCAAKNGYFAGGHGDFSVIPDRELGYFYFLFTNYAGPAENQGVAIARMAFADRFDPAGAVYKNYNGEWSAPGIGGAVTPILPVTTPWEHSDTDSFWGPAIHWNTYLERFVMVLNRSCCEAWWPQEGIYIMFATDLADVTSWTPPKKLLDAAEVPFAPAFYPQIIGTGPGESDTLAGESPRLFIKGVSSWEILFNPELGMEGPNDCDSDDLLRRDHGRAGPAGTPARCGPAVGSSSTLPIFRRPTRK